MRVSALIKSILITLTKWVGFLEAKKRNTMQLVKNHKNWGEWINNRQYKL